MRDELYDLEALILAQGSDGMDTDLTDEEFAKQMNVEDQTSPKTPNTNTWMINLMRRL